jgi:hypothetical protein
MISAHPAKNPSIGEKIATTHAYRAPALTATRFKWLKANTMPNTIEDAGRCQNADGADEGGRARRDAVSGAAAGDTHDDRFGKTQRVGAKPWISVASRARSHSADSLLSTQHAKVAYPPNEDLIMSWPFSGNSSAARRGVGMLRLGDIDAEISTERRKRSFVKGR